MEPIHGVLCLTLACWARAAGLTRTEASQLQDLLLTSQLPTSADQAWQQLDEATMAIRRGRRPAN